ncbi:hypothetical protein ACIBJF_39915, partial [Streptomyces sp. NPDC050743]|uniref:hypothetical protein n=1 Tax=Streptomyces sp. NPDC050743 TaxID=3365634 RepID=UPI00378D4725
SAPTNTRTENTMKQPIRTLKTLPRRRPVTDLGAGQHRGQPATERPSALDAPGNGRHRRTETPALPATA